MSYNNQMLPPLTKRAMLHLNPGGEAVKARPAGHAGRNWDRQYGETHNPDGTVKVATTTPATTTDTAVTTSTTGSTNRAEGGAGAIVGGREETEGTQGTSQGRGAGEIVGIDNDPAAKAEQVAQEEAAAQAEQDAILADQNRRQQSQLNYATSTVITPDGPTNTFTDKGEEEIDALIKAAGDGGDDNEKSKIMEWMESLGLGEYFDKGQIANMAVQYLGSRILGYDHGASANYAIKNYGQRVQQAMQSDAATRQQYEERAYELFKDGKITKEQYNQMAATGVMPDELTSSNKRTGQEGTVRVDGGKYNDQVFNTYQLETDQGKITYVDLGNGQSIPLADLRSTIRDQGGTVQDGSGPTREEISEKYNSWANNVTSDIDKIVNQVNARDPKTNQRKFRMTVTPSEIANQAATQFERMGYDIDDPTVLRKMNGIIAKATRGLLAEQQADQDVDIGYINAYINREVAQISTGLDYDIYALNPDETDIRKRKYVPGRLIERQRNDIESLVRSELGDKAQNRYEVEMRVRQWYQQLANAWDNMDEKKRKEILGKQSKGDDENDFYLFVQGRIAKGQNALSG